MAHLLSSTFWESKWISTASSVHRRLPDTRGQSEREGGGVRWGGLQSVSIRRSGGGQGSRNRQANEFQTMNSTWELYVWGMRENFKNPWAINQSESSRTAWQSAHIIGGQAHIRYAFSGARSKLESQLTLLIALSYLIWETMGIEEEAFTISSFCHDSEARRLPPCFHFN